FGLPVLEAMACRCPVIATKAGCAPDFIVRGVNGELNEIDDIVAQGESIIKIIEMKNSAWKAMSEAAHEAITKSSWDDSIDTFEKSLLK
ncbi:MAG TPA: glycosyltransferase, partial [Ectothiorhodospiraceae bacterium]|nr:glycosyltransferase [Ectothiorhodospiraceae bacterium]